MSGCRLLTQGGIALAIVAIVLVSQHDSPIRRWSDRTPRRAGRHRSGVRLGCRDRVVLSCAGANERRGGSVAASRIARTVDRRLRADRCGAAQATETASARC